MASETKAQRVARLRREIDTIEQTAMRKAEAKREQLAKIESRTEPEADFLKVRVRFQFNRKVYTYLLVRTQVGYFTTGSGSSSHFVDWDAVCDWLESDEVHWHSGVEALAGTGEMALPAKGNEPRAPYGDMGLGGDYS